MARSAVAVAEKAPARDASGEGVRKAVQTFIDRLQSTADLRVSQKRDVEERWIENLLQYHGKYDGKTLANLGSDGTKSRLFVNKTRRKTNAMAARLFDMLFPTDDRNWSIAPSPVPELDIEKERRQGAASDANAAVRSQELEEGLAAPGAAEQSPLSPKMQMLKAEAERLQALADEAQGVMTAARLKCDLMQAEIDDKLKACAYQAACRDQIEWACKIGTGIVKGPITGAKMQARWQQPEKLGEDGKPLRDEFGQVVREGEYAIALTQDEQPAFVAIDPWSYFPDMESGPNVQDGEGDFVRHLLNKKKLRELAKRPGFNQDAIRRLLTAGPQGTMPTYLQDLRSIGGETLTIRGDCFQVWEYSGPVTAEDMRDSAVFLEDHDLLDDAEAADPLEESRACVWFCQGELLYFGPYPLDSGETLFSVFNLEKDEISPFGYGMADFIRDPQKAFNGAWRMMMDNAPLSAMPQLVVNKDVIEPEDGDWNIVGRKTWLLKGSLPPGQRAFDLFDIPTRQAELQAIIEMAAAFIDDESGISQIAEGEQGADVTKTVAGMAMLMNSSNILLRRIVRNYDDDVTVPNIRRTYHFEMQHSPKQEIKGDYQVDARGSSVLLVRELQQQNLIVIANLFGGHPVFGKMIKNAELLRLIFGAMMIPADQIVKTDAEIKVAEIEEQKLLEAQQAAGAPAAPAGKDPALEQAKLDIEEMKLEVMREVANMKTDTERYVAEMRRDIEMAKIAEALNMTDAELEAKVAVEREKLASKENIFAGEAAMTMRRDQQAREDGDVDRAVNLSEAERDRQESREAGDKDREVKKATAKSKPPSTGGGYL